MAATIQDKVDEMVRSLNQDGQPSPVVGEVTLHVDYQIIEHFSNHLYDSPNKAIEELVANSFDAFATVVRVFTPGPYTASRVLVWDDGESMDVEGLKQLWWIAKSPKLDGNRVSTREGASRKIIGKFGIGKLASYSVGEVISHVCRHKGEFYLVSVDYGQMRGTDGAPSVSSDNPITAPVVRLEKRFALELVKGLFDTAPQSLDEMLEMNSWTFAIIENLKTVDLPAGRLMWVLGNGMPLRPDFRITVNDVGVAAKLDKQAITNWDFGSKKVTDAIHKRWKDAMEKEGFAPIVCVGNEVGLDPSQPTETVPFIEFKNLGRVWGCVRLFDQTLLGHRAADHGRSHGFFLFVRGRLLNPDDEHLFLADPSFQSFYRSQFIIYADDLDRELLADRQRLRRDAAVRELELLQKALAGVARIAVEARDAEQDAKESTWSVLPVSSRAYFRDPLNALLLKTPIEAVGDFDPTKVKVERKNLGERARISEFALDDGGFHVNADHPYYAALASRAGQSKAAREFLRTFDLFAISERLLEGHLLDIGLAEGVVAEVVEWREGLFRQLANSYDKVPEIVADARRTSHLGDRPFEKALHGMFVEMGFKAYHEGGRGREDVLVVAAVGPESFRFIVEAKGSSGELRNADAKVGAAASHRDQVRAEHALIVARRFGGFGSDRASTDAAVYRECESTGGVSIMEIEALEEVFVAIARFSYPLPLLRDIFMTLESPAGKLATIRGLNKPGGGIRLLSIIGTHLGKAGRRSRGGCCYVSLNLPRRTMEERRDELRGIPTTPRRRRHTCRGANIDEHESRTCISETVARFGVGTDREILAG